MPAPPAARPGLLAVCRLLAAVPAPPPRRSRDADGSGPATVPVARRGSRGFRQPSAEHRETQVVPAGCREARIASAVAAHCAGSASCPSRYAIRAGSASRPSGASVSRETLVRPRASVGRCACARRAGSLFGSRGSCPPARPGARVVCSASVRPSDGRVGGLAGSRTCTRGFAGPSGRRARVLHVKHSFLSVSSGIAQMFHVKHRFVGENALFRRSAVFPL